MAPKYLRDLQEQIAYHLDEIGRLFKHPKITIVVRNDELADGDVVLSDDDLNKAIAAIARLQTKAAHVLPADSAVGREKGDEGQ